MAPTQILAEQHYDVLRRWLDPLGLRIALRTPRGRKRAVRCRCLRGTVTRETLLLFREARPSRVPVLLSRQHEILMNSGLTRKIRRRETQRPTRETRVLPKRSRATSHTSSSGRTRCFTNRFRFRISDLL